MKIYNYSLNVFFFLLMLAVCTLYMAVCIAVSVSVGELLSIRETYIVLSMGGFVFGFMTLLVSAALFEQVLNKIMIRLLTGK